MKKALCITKQDLDINFASTDIQPVPDGFFDLPARLIDRGACETDESLLQVIPYIVLRDTDGSIFCYERGGGGGESRLHAKLSVGLGGHVDIQPGEGDMHTALRFEAERELREEVGFSIDIEHFHGLVYTGALDTPVDKVHLGLVTSVTVSGFTEVEPEPGSIENGRWLTLNELLAPDVYDRLEPWSQAVARRLKRKLSESLGDTLRIVGTLLQEVHIESHTGATSMAAQEMANILRGIGTNLSVGHAVASVYDDDTVLDELSRGFVALEACAFDMGRG